MRSNILLEAPEQNNSLIYKIKRQFKIYGQNKYLILLFLPGLIWFIIFKYGPMYGLLMAFQDYSLVKGVWGSTWVGLKHFQYLFTGPDFLPVLKNTIIISAYKIIFGFPAPIILALMLNEVKSTAFKRTIQTVSYLPHFFSWVVLAGLVMMALSPSVGIVNQIIQAFGGKPIFFVADKQWFRTVLVATDIWASIGWGSIIYLAAIAGLDPELYEAAVLDGANRWQRIRHITIPGIAPTIAVMLILRTGSILDAGFDQVMNLYSPPVYDVADIIDTYMYRMGIGGFQFSLTTAAGMFKSVIGFVLIIITNILSKRVSEGEYGIW
ncbi:ABC transporter permease [Mahella australiensis]|nr:ABC transporter permease subunit [Mahella australiensis]